ncbi:MAG: universal stress protein UspA [Acidobacteriota bacterium]
MEKHLLIAISDDTTGLHGVRFVTSFFGKSPQIRITLFTVAAQPVKHTGPHAEVHHHKDGHPLESAQRMLIDAGIPEDHIKVKAVSKRFGTVKDIIGESRAGLYDAVVLGNRGFTLLQETFSAPSVGKELLQHQIDFPIWICRRPQAGLSNILLCVDDSEPSLRIADHVGFILEEEPGHSITMLYVDEGKGHNADAVFEPVYKALLANKVPEDRISRMVARSSNIPQAILQEAARGAYAAVAMGRGGKEPTGMLDKWRMGSRSLKVMESLEHAVLWISK